MEIYMKTRKTEKSCEMRVDGTASQSGSVKDGEFNQLSDSQLLKIDCAVLGTAGWDHQCVTS
jgi:hypothetical protein